MQRFPFTLMVALAFLVTISDHGIKVISPSHHSPHLHVTFKNTTLEKIVGKIQTESGRILDRITLSPREIKSIPIGHIRGEKIFYYPLTPSLQKAKLSIGQPPYEIPTKK